MFCVKGVSKCQMLSVCRDIMYVRNNTDGGLLCPDQRTYIIVCPYNRQSFDTPSSGKSRLIDAGRSHLAVTLIPLLLLWRFHAVVLADDASLVEVVGDGEDDVMKLQALLVVVRNCVV